jgi:hypothetical protein
MNPLPPYLFPINHGPIANLLRRPSDVDMLQVKFLWIATRCVVPPECISLPYAEIDIYPER